jgi:hypothetical protein
VLKGQYPISGINRPKPAAKRSTRNVRSGHVPTSTASFALPCKLLKPEGQSSGGTQLADSTGSNLSGTPRPRALRFAYDARRRSWRRILLLLTLVINRPALIIHPSRVRSDRVIGAWMRDARTLGSRSKGQQGSQDVSAANFSSGDQAALSRVPHFAVFEVEWIRKNCIGRALMRSNPSD